MPFEEYERELLSAIAGAAIIAGLVLFTAWGVLPGSDGVALLALLLIAVGGIVEWASGWWRFE